VTEIFIRGPDFSYVALVGSGLLGSIGSSLAQTRRPGRCAIISDDVVGPLFGQLVGDSLTRSGFKPLLITIPPGENSKSFEEAAKICDQMAAAGLDRDSLVVALGGGVVGDLAGFVAAIYHRGLPYVHVPTTLLAQVDSSIGGKTAVNTAQGKNLIGALHHPALVISDIAALATLPPRSFKQGFAEIIKHAVICDAEMLEKVANASSLRPDKNASWKPALQSLIRRNIEIKAALISADVRELNDQRVLLNFGHTVGHAIELAGDYARFLHGEAVSLGMAAACEISVRKAGLSEAERTRIMQTIEACDLPTRLPADFPRDMILKAVERDKKFRDGEVKFVVTPSIGCAHVAADVTMDDIRMAVEKL
jgi:3-dehydroquinate synthase